MLLLHRCILLRREKLSAWAGPKGYEDWLKVVCGIPEHKEVKTAAKKKVANSSISFPRS